MIESKPNLSILSISLGSGGAEKVISLLLKELIKDFNVTLILFYNEVHFTIPNEVEVICLSKKKPLRPFFLKIMDSIYFLIKYIQILNKRKIHISISFLAFPNFINGITSIFNKKIKTIISERGFPSDNTTSKLSLKISKIFYPLLYNRCDKLFSNSIFINNDLKDNFGVKIPMDVIYNPIEAPKETIHPKSLNNNNSIMKVITAGTLNKRKNQIIIVNAIKNSDKNYELTILGEGNLKGFLNSQIKAHKLEKSVLLKGKVRNVNDYLIKSDCFVLSSFTEGFPNALLEAMAAGLPSISTNCLSGPLELLNDNQSVIISKNDFYKAKYGILINNDDDIALRKALDYLRDNPKEREKYSELSLIRSNDYQLKSIYFKFKQFIKN